MKKIILFFNSLLAICLIIGIWSNFFYPQNLIQSTFIVILIIGIYILKNNVNFSKIRNYIKKNASKIIKTLFLLMIIFQVIVLINFKMTIYHDPFRVIYQADLLSHDHIDWDYNSYFSYAPNNVVLSVLLSVWLKLTQLVSIPTNIAINVLTITILDITIFMTLKIIRLVTSNSLFQVGVMLFFWATPLAYTYLLQVFYSDGILLFCFVNLIYLLLNWKNVSHYIKWIYGFLLTIIAALGMIIKPNFIVIEIALFLIVILKKVNGRGSLIVPFICVTVGLCLTPIINKEIETAVGYSPDTQYKLPISNWIYMGLNEKTSGTYSYEDIEKLEDVEYKSRTSESFDLIKERINKLGFFGLFQQWISKMEILENFGTIQNAYIGGTYSAPTWFLRYKKFISGFISVLMRTAIIILMYLLLKKTLLFDINDISNRNWLFIELTILGLIGFHTLIWETESRYGLPLIFLYLILVSLPIKQVKMNLKNRKGLLVTSFLILIFCGYNLFFSRLKDNIELNPYVITAQRSQLSEKYQTKTVKLSPREKISEKVFLPVNVSYFSVLIPEKTKLEGQLINTKTKKKYPLQKETKSLVYDGKITKGSYIIQIKNASNTDQICWIVSPASYQLSEYKIQHQGNKYLIYKFEK